MTNEWEIKQQICDIGRRIYLQGFAAANDGNISVRVGPNRFLCTPTMVSKGFLKPEDIAVVDGQGKQLSGPRPRTSEILLHLEIYHQLPHINAVVHAHPPHATAFAVAGVQLPTCVLPEVELFLGPVPLADYETPGSQSFAQTILPHLRNKANTIMLASHGAVACDAELEQAYFHLETLDMYCRILLLAKQVGSIQQIPPGKMGELLELKKKYGIADPRHEGQALTLCGSDEFLRGFSTRPIPGHEAAADGHGRGVGIGGMPSQAGQPQPKTPAASAVAEPPTRLGQSSKTVQERSAADEQERLVQLVTDRIVELLGQQ